MDLGNLYGESNEMPYTFLKWLVQRFFFHLQAKISFVGKNKF